MSWKIATGLVLIFLMTLPAQAGELKVTITGVRSDAGALMVGLYDSADKFTKAVGHAAHVALLSDKGRREGVTLRAIVGSQGIGFMMLPPGRYAVIVFHDQNDDGLLNKSILGIPTEGYGFSNNASGFFGAPSFDAAAVTMGDEDKSISISLIYPSAPSRPRLGK